MAELNLNDIQVVQKSDTQSSTKSPIKKVHPEYHHNSESESNADLEMLANVKKVKQKSYSIGRKSKSKSESEKRYKEKVRDYNESVSRRSDSESVPRVPRKKTVAEENDDSMIRQEKTRLLGFLDKVCTENKRSFRYDMTYSLDELKENLKNEQEESNKLSGAQFLKQGLKFVTAGMEWGNNRFDPIGLKLNGWSKSMALDIDAEKYDRVLYQLYEKYGMSAGMGPEMELAFMMLQSVLFYHLSQSVKENPAQLSNLMNMFTGKVPQSQPQRPPQQHFQEPVDILEMRPQQQMAPSQHQSQQPHHKPVFSDSDTSDDLEPSKIPSQDYKSILQKMKAAQTQGKGDVFVDVPEPSPVVKKRRGRPPKVKPPV